MTNSACIIFPDAIKLMGSEAGVVFSVLHQTYAFGMGQNYNGEPLLNAEGYASVSVNYVFGDFGYTKEELTEACETIKDHELLDDYAFVGSTLHFKMPVKKGDH